MKIRQVRVSPLQAGLVLGFGAALVQAYFKVIPSCGLWDLHGLSSKGFIQLACRPPAAPKLGLQPGIDQLGSVVMEAEGDAFFKAIKGIFPSGRYDLEV